MLRQNILRAETFNSKWGKTRKCNCKERDVGSTLWSGNLVLVAVDLEDITAPGTF